MIDDSSVLTPLLNIKDNRGGGLLSVVHVNVMSVFSGSMLSVE